MEGGQRIRKLRGRRVRVRVRVRALGGKTGSIEVSYGKKKLKEEERIHAWISNFTLEHLEEIARFFFLKVVFSFRDNLCAVMLLFHTWD